VGRFLSADPFVSCLESTQGWNRFAYVQARALSATDPSGFFPGSPKKTVSFDQGCNGCIETVVVTASRIDRLVPSATGGATLAAGTISVGPPRVDRGVGSISATKARSRSDCRDDCQQVMRPLAAALSGAIGGAAGGLVGAPGPTKIVGVAAGAFAGAIIGLVNTSFAGQSNSSRFVASASVGAVMGAETALLQGGVQGTRAVASSILGSTVGIMYGSFAGNAVGIASSGGANIPGFAIAVVTATIVDKQADKMVDAFCASKCSK
jgi:hypothetical protein